MNRENAIFQDGQNDCIINIVVTLLTSYRPDKTDVEKYNMARKLLIEMRDGSAGNTR